MRRKLPIATISIWILTAVLTGWQLFNPAVLEALRRNPQALTAGEWWRVISPLFVHSDGWTQIIANLAGIAIVGSAAESVFGSLGWLMIYFGAAIAGEIAGYAWDPTGAGASIAVFGLIGALLVWQAQHDRPIGALALLYGLCFLFAQVGMALGGIWIAILLAALAGSLMGQFLRMEKLTPTVLRGIVMAGLLAGVLLTALSDNHGPPLLTGMAVAFLLVRLQ